MSEEPDKSLDEIKCEPLEGYNHIFKLNGFSLTSKMISFYKYMSLDRFVNSVEKKELVFVSPKTWNDPFERLYFDGNYKKHNYTPEEIACLCVTYKESENEEAAWRIYSDQNKPSVRISFVIDVLLRLLDDYARKKNCKIYIGKMNYSFNKNDITAIAKVKTPIHTIYCPPVMSTEHYLSLMLLKRMSFAYENEIRIFIVKEKGLYETVEELDEDKKLLKLECDYIKNHIISKVMLSPHPAVDSSTSIGKIYKQLYKIQTEKMKNQVDKLLNKSGITYQCRLYESKPSIVIE